MGTPALADSSSRATGRRPGVLWLGVVAITGAVPLTAPADVSRWSATTIAVAQPAETILMRLIDSSERPRGALVIGRFGDDSGRWIVRPDPSVVDTKLVGALCLAEGCRVITVHETSFASDSEGTHLRADVDGVGPLVLDWKDGPSVPDSTLGSPSCDASSIAHGWTAGLEADTIRSTPATNPVRLIGAATGQLGEWELVPTTAHPPSGEDAICGFSMRGAVGQLTLRYERS